jgi:hypothetical protein
MFPELPIAAIIVLALFLLVCLALLANSIYRHIDETRLFTHDGRRRYCNLCGGKQLWVNNNDYYSDGRWIKQSKVWDKSCKCNKYLH